MALGLAIGVLVIGSGLAALLFFVAFEEKRLSDSSGRVNQAFGVAEEGALEVLRTWDPRVYNVHDPYPLDSATVPWRSSLHGTGAYGGRVDKLNGELYLVEVTGQAAATRQRIGVVARVRPGVPGVVAALTAGKGSRRSGSISIDGHDLLPDGWDACGPADSTRAGLQVDSAARSLAGVAVGGFTYSQLVSLATRAIPARAYIAIAPAVVDGRCDETVATNWGGGSQPHEACGGYLPVVHVVGDATLAGGEGQGTLLVDGDLLLRGNLRWRGLVLVLGTLRVAGDAHAAIWGGVFVGDSAVLDAGVAGSVAITYSKCAIVKALETVTPAILLSRRGWIGLSEEP